MSIEAPLSRYKKNNMLIMAAILLAAGVWFYYDSHMNKNFIAENTNADGSMNSTLKFNYYGWPLLVAGGVFSALRFAVSRNKKVVADEQQITAGKTVIPYDTVEKINKTHFEKKGFFTITYNIAGQSKDLTLSERTYDNLAAVLNHIVKKIS